MTGRTHDLAAVTALMGLFIVVQPQGLALSTVIVALVANLIGGITPDIDQPTAPLWRNLPVGKYLGRVFGVLSGGHRFLTHSLIGVALIGWLVWLLLMFLKPIMGAIDITVVWDAFMIGVISHLIMDLFTKEGVPLLLPIPVKIGFPPVKRLRITTGKLVENIIVFPGLVILLLFIVLQNYGTLLTFVHTLGA